MPKLKAPLSPKRIKALPDGRHYGGHVPGLAVHRNGKARSWLLCYMLAGRQRELGLGSFREVDLEEACDAALSARRLLREGIDPIESKRERRQEAIDSARRALTFSAAVKEFLVAKESGWKNAKHRQQWANTLKDYAEPTLGAIRVAAHVRTKATHAQWDEFELADVKATIELARELIESKLDG